MKLIMSYHKAIVFIITTLGIFVQVESQSKNSSPFDTHRFIMYAFFIVWSIYVVNLIAATVQEDGDQNTENDNHNGVSSKISLLIGAMAAILLLFIIRPVLGWVTLVLWILYSSKTAYELVNVESFLQYLEKLKNIFLELIGKLKNVVCGQS